MIPTNKNQIKGWGKYLTTGQHNNVLKTKTNTGTLCGRMYYLEIRIYLDISKH